MLRRKPTALTITNEDIAAFEEQLARRLAYTRYLKTGEDPEGYFRNHQQQQQPPGGGGHYYDQDAQMQQMTNNQRDAANNHNNNGMSATTTTIDPNDELKPLPGDKARINYRDGK
ncbi:hypothetical protein LTS17_009926 [Exophiala oligosperma]